MNALERGEKILFFYGPDGPRGSGRGGKREQGKVSLLSEQEKSALIATVRECGAREAAASLKIEPTTVYSQLKTAYRKLGLEPGNILLAAVNAINSGQIAIEDCVRQGYDFRRLGRLSVRELELLETELENPGATDADIAQLVDLQTGPTKNSLIIIREKLGARSTAQAAIIYRRGEELRKRPSFYYQPNQSQEIYDCVKIVSGKYPGMGIIVDSWGHSQILAAMPTGDTEEFFRRIIEKESRLRRLSDMLKMTPRVEQNYQRYTFINNSENLDRMLQNPQVRDSIDKIRGRRVRR